MADEYHRDQIEHYKPKELSGSAKELLHENFDYTGGTNVAPSNDSSVGAGHKYHNHHSPLSINTTHSHMEELAEYPAKQRELWVHDGECLIDKLIKDKA